MKSMILLVATAIMVILGFTGIANIYGQEKVENPFFSINIPDNWAYVEGSNTIEAKNQGFGPVNSIELTPNEFSDILASDDVVKIPYAQFIQDIDYPKNAPLESYVKNRIENFSIQNITSQQYTTVGNEKSIRLYANESAYFGDNKIVFYFVMHDKQPYLMGFTANPKNYEKYLPEFEQMVKSFRFVGSPSSDIENLSENENETNRTTNFSGANLTDLSTNRTGNSDYPEELYYECVGVAGKSFCDFLFKK